MEESLPNLNQRIAERVRELRAARSLSLDALSNRSGVSRAMISLIERGETSATAVVLEKLAGGLNVTLASLFEAPSAADSPSGPVLRRSEQPEWQDPISGYRRRNVSPPGVTQPMQVVDVTFPPRGRVAFDTSARDVRIYQQIWILEGTMEITLGTKRYRLREGDCLAMELDGPTTFENPTRKTARYAVVSVCEPASRKR